MERGWIKFWRKTEDNDIWKYDRTAWFVFEYLLISCDKKTGHIRAGRTAISKSLKLNPNTLYKAIKRLEKAKMIVLVSNNKYTDFFICNWKNYQSSGNNNNANYQVGNNKVTTKTAFSNNQITDIKDAGGNNKKNKKDDFGNTIQEYKNKKKKEEERKKKKKDNTIVLSTNDYIIFKETWKKLYGKYPTGGAKLVDYPIKRLVKAYTLEKVCGAIIWAEANRKNNQFIPTFNNPLDLERKWNSLVTQARKEKNGTEKRGIRL